MFTPKMFKNENIEEIHDFLNNNGFGILVNQLDAKILATHIPMEFCKNADEKYVLKGHISKANPQWKSFVDQPNVLAIFQGPHAYISSSWYNHQNVPTWNYIAVHVYGKIRILGEEELRQSLADLMAKYEKNMPNPQSLAKLPTDYVTKEMRGIVGFEIEIEEIQPTYKLSQNRNAEDYANVINELEKSDDFNAKATAKAMKVNKEI